MSGIASVMIFTGCVGYVDDGGGGAVVVGAPPPPNVILFGGDYDRDRDVHAYWRRGHESRDFDAHHFAQHGPGPGHSGRRH